MDQFRPIFKLTKNSLLSECSFIDFTNFPENNTDLRQLEVQKIENANENSISYLIPITKWKCYELVSNPGLIFVKNPFTDTGLKYWIERCLKDFPFPPNKTNLYNKNKNSSILDGLRWSTFGFHHNWDSKEYDFEDRNEFPPDLAELCKQICRNLGLCNNFNAEAAIVNYYPLKSTIYCHVDRSEPNLEAPLISISFGLSALFLIGGETLSTAPTSIKIDNGDIVVMSGPSRICYHAVPKIIPSKKSVFSHSDNEFVNNYINNHRVNLNIRQVF